jgi:hypothetical protein
MDIEWKFGLLENAHNAKKSISLRKHLAIAPAKKEQYYNVLGIKISLLIPSLSEFVFKSEFRRGKSSHINENN